MRLNLIYNKEMPDYKTSLEVAEKALLENNLEFKSYELGNMGTYGEFSFVLGGDGTLIKAAKFYSENETPVLGINLGRLGFLAQAGINGIQGVIEAIKDKNYTIEERLMLSSANRLALNDFIVKGANPSRTSKFYLEINNKFVCDYIADGLIIATPTGSTAYGLSAGGPVLYPTLDSIVIVPICPHTLNARPLVVPASEIIKVKTSDELLSVSVDGHIVEELVSSITINSADKKAKLVFPEKTGFYSVLRNKLHWGVSPSSER